MSTNTQPFKKFWVMSVNNWICDADYNGKALKERNPLPTFRKFYFIKDENGLQGFSTRNGLPNDELVNQLLNPNPSIPEGEQSEKEVDLLEGYTGGNWKYNKVDYADEIDIITDTPKGQNTNGYVCSIRVPLYTVPNQAEANARLIASAPLLAIRVKELEQQIEVMKHNNQTACLLAMEFGYKQCEKGENMDGAYINYRNILNNNKR